MKFDLKKLTHALAVERLGSFSLAADELGLTQPTLSRSISSLEAAWGARVFERGRNGVAATSVGREMLREASELLAQARTLDRNMSLRASAKAGAIAFGFSGLIGAVFIADLLASISRTSPDLKVTGRVETMSELIAHIKSDRIEFAVFSDTQEPEDDALSFVSIGTIPVRFVVRPGHPLAQQPAVRWEDLKDFPLGSSTPTRAPVLPRDPTIICDNYGIARDLMLRSDIVWLSSPWVFWSDSETEKACALRVTGDMRSEEANIWIASPKGRLKSPAAAMVIATLRDMVSQMPR